MSNNINVDLIITVTFILIFEYHKHSPILIINKFTLKEMHYYNICGSNLYILIYILINQFLFNLYSINKIY